MVPLVHFNEAAAVIDTEIIAEDPSALQDEASLSATLSKALRLTVGSTKCGVSLTPKYDVLLGDRRVGLMKEKSPLSVSVSLVKERGKSIAPVVQKVLRSVMINVRSREAAALLTKGVQISLRCSVQDMQRQSTWNHAFPVVLIAKSGPSP